MKSIIASAINLQIEPVALVWTEEKPEGALQFEPGRWGCVMNMFGAAATKGKSAVFDKESYGCFGGGMGLGFGNTYENFPGGTEGFCHFLADGNEKTEKGRQIGAGMTAGGARAEFVHHFLHGERYKKNPELVKSYLAALPITEIPTRYAAFVPLCDVQPGVEPASITFLVNPDQLSALVVLANYDRPGLENVTIPFVAGCKSVGIMAYGESASERLRCVVGLVDLSARQYLRSVAGRELMTFTMPYRRYLQMEQAVEGSFLEQEPWSELKK